MLTSLFMIATIISQPQTYCDRDPLHHGHYNFYLQQAVSTLPECQYGIDFACWAAELDAYIHFLNQQDIGYRVAYCECIENNINNPWDRSTCMAEVYKLFIDQMDFRFDNYLFTIQGCCIVTP